MGSSPDPLAAFYGGYERTNLVRRPLFRIRPMAVAIAIGAIALIAVVAADAALITGGSPKVDVTSVAWEVEGTLLATTTGFQAHASQTIPLTLTCSTVCYRFTGATVNAPFRVVAFATIDSPIQFTNVTVQTPSGAYTGQLVVSLELPSDPGTSSPVS